jgi:heme O synthase-like polyprenyltransferase
MKKTRRTALSTMTALGKWLAANKKPLGIAAGITGAAGAGAAAAPAIDEFITDQALASMGRTAKRAVADTAEFAEEHPYMLAGLVGGSGLAGAKLGEEGFSGLFDTVSPLQMGGLAKQRTRMQRGTRGQR